MRRFRCYRPAPPPEYHAQGAANPPDQVQFEGVIFSDGTCAVRWLTEYRSHSVWASYDDLMRIHGHPEYGTVIEWLDGDASEQPDPFTRSLDGLAGEQVAELRAELRAVTEKGRDR
jgi:hypothetical protein